MAVSLHLTGGASSVLRDETRAWDPSTIPMRAARLGPSEPTKVGAGGGLADLHPLPAESKAMPYQDDLSRVGRISITITQAGDPHDTMLNTDLERYF